MIQAFTTEQAEYRRFLARRRRASTRRPPPLHVPERLFGVRERAHRSRDGGRALVRRDARARRALTPATCSSSRATWPRSTRPSTASRRPGASSRARGSARSACSRSSTRRPTWSRAARPRRADEVHGASASRTSRFGYDAAAPCCAACLRRAAPGQLVAHRRRHRRGQDDAREPDPALLRRAGGRGAVDGIDVREFKLRSLRAQVAMVLQPPLVFSDHAPREHRLRPARREREEVERRGQPGAARRFHRARCPRATTRIVGEGGATLSSGEQPAVRSRAPSCATRRS